MHNPPFDSFAEYLLISEDFRFHFGRQGVGLSDLLSLRRIVRLGKRLKGQKEEFVRFARALKNDISPFLVVISLVLMGINTQVFLNQNPEVLGASYQVEELLTNVGSFLDKYPRIKEYF